MGGISDLKFAHSTAPDGSGGWFDEVVEATDTIGTDCSLAFINGRPSIACRDGVNNDLKFYWYQ